MQSATVNYAESTANRYDVVKFDAAVM